MGDIIDIRQRRPGTNDEQASVRRGLKRLLRDAFDALTPQATEFEAIVEGKFRQAGQDPRNMLFVVARSSERCFDGFHHQCFVIPITADRETWLQNIATDCGPIIVAFPLRDEKGRDKDFYARDMWGPKGRFYESMQLLDFPKIHPSVGNVPLPVYAAFSGKPKRPPPPGPGGWAA